MAYTENIQTLTNVTAAGTTTSSTYDVSLRSSVAFTFTCANHTAGNGVFSVDASIDGTNWVTGIALQDATATTSTTYVTSKTLNSNTTAGVYLPINAFRYVRVNVVVTTDGTYNAWMQTRS